MKNYNGEIAELTLSLDVIYHLIEDDVFEFHMRRLFDSSTRYVIIYSSNKYDPHERTVPHIKHRKFTQWVKENVCGWKLIQYIPNKYSDTLDIEKGSFAEFFIYKKI